MQPKQVNSFGPVNPEYLSGDGSSHMDGSAPIYSGGGDSTTNKLSNANQLNNTLGQLQNGILHTANGSASASELAAATSVTSIGGIKHH